MGLFGRDERTESKSASPSEPKPRPRNGQPAGSASTLIAKGTHIEGRIDGKGDVRVEGSVKGKLECSSTVHVAEGGRVEAAVQAETISIAGRVRGNVTGSRKIELGPSADVEGDITAPRILIREGATFEGQVNMTGKKAAKNAEPAKKADTPSAPEKSE
ncbi:MAG: polymer-forming cytoskeletal protein [Thermoanaerobaculales bacterium]|jgi:cytoskeletal protein CcmA (bactofilin family)|nr:polymer-forming cytoskeletal protein [Thermoanaerobaculales bacterium]